LAGRKYRETNGMRVFCDKCHLARVVQSHDVSGSVSGMASRHQKGPIRVITFAKYGLCLLVLLMAKTTVAQMQVGDDVTMRMSGNLTAGYAGDYGNLIPSDHSLNFGADSQLTGDYYNPNFLNFSITPYYNRSSANSSFSSLTDASGVDARANIFSGSRFPGFVDYHYAYNSTGNFGLVGAPNFTTIGTGQGFGIGWSALLPDWPTFSVSYSEGSGSGNVYGTNEESSSTTKTLNLRSSYRLGGWNLNASYQHLNYGSDIPMFLSGQLGTSTSDFSGNSYSVNGFHNLPWNGSIALSFNRSTYSGNFGEVAQSISNSNFTTDTEAALLNFHPTNKLTLFADQSFTDNLNGFFYQNLTNNGGGVPLLPENSQSNSNTLSSGASYLITANLFGQAQITYYNQSYLGQNYNGSYFSGTVGYNKRILQIFTVSATVIESTNQFANNALGYIFNVDAFHNFSGWETSGNFSYAQNIQTLLVTYTTSYYNYSANVHRRLGRGRQWTGAFNGSHNGLTNQPGSDNHSESYSTSLALNKIALSANYTTSAGNALLTSTGIQPISPTPGLLPEGLIVYNGKSYGGSLTLTPVPRLSISGTYSHAVSDTLSNDISSNNKTNIFYGQFQYRLRRISVLGGYTNFLQGISAAGTPAAHTYSYFIGVQRWINFF
jgi:hypothetical protein